MSNEIRSFTGRAADLMNQVCFSKPDRTPHTDKHYREQMEKSNTVGRKIIRGIGRFFLGGIISHVAAPIGTVYHLSASALCYGKAACQKGESKEKTLQKAKAHSKAFAIDGGITTCLALAYGTGGIFAEIGIIGLAITKLAYVIAPNRFAHHVGENLNPKDKYKTDSYESYNDSLADRVFVKEACQNTAA